MEHLFVNVQTIPDEQSFFVHGHYRLGYEVYGPLCGTPVILVHGILLDAYCNRDIARALADEGYRVILLDLLGHGRSDKPTRAAEHRIDFYAEQVLGLLDHLKLERAVLGGVSLGAITTLTVACLAPHRVRALLLEMPVMETAVPAAVLMLMPLLIAVHFARPVYRLFAHLLRKLPEPRHAMLNSLRNALAAEPEVIAAILHGVMVGPVVPTVRRRQQIQQPVLVIGHACDPLHDLADARALKRQLPNASLVLARSLWELRTRPERLMPELLAFLHALPADRPIVPGLALVTGGERLNDFAPNVAPTNSAYHWMPPARSALTLGHETAPEPVPETSCLVSAFGNRGRQAKHSAGF